MPIFSYIDTTGKMSQINAMDANEALKNAPNRKSDSGVSLESNTSLYEPKKPVGILSTNNAIDSVNKSLGDLNRISPKTAPGYVPVPAYGTKNTDGSINKFDPNTGKSTAPEIQAPKAYFQNEAGQEAEFTQEQLNDPKIQKLIQDQGYMQIKTEGPNYDGSSKLRSEIDDYNSRLEEIANDFVNYSVDEDPAFQLKAQSIKNQFDILRKETEKVNAQREKTFQTLGYRLGTTQYSGFTQLGILGEELNQANQRIAEVNVQEAEAISAARTAYQTGKYAEFEKKMKALQDIRDTKDKTLTEYNQKLADVIKTTRETTVQASRDSAVAGLLSQGVTDPAQILDYLNYDEDGNQVGDFTAKEVKDALKNLSPEGNYDKLSSDVRDYFILRDNNSLPEAISALPEGQQMGAFIQYMKQKSKTSSGGTANAITLSEARTNGLPLSTVGMSENEILQSFNSDVPPKWFIDKMQNELGSLASGSYADNSSHLDVNGMWKQYREEYLSSFGEKSVKGEATDYTDRAKQYFVDSFEGVDDATAQTLADQVQLLIDGGSTYAKAVEEVTKQVSE